MTRVPALVLVLSSIAGRSRRIIDTGIAIAVAIAIAAQRDSNLLHGRAVAAHGRECKCRARATSTAQPRVFARQARS